MDKKNVISVISHEERELLRLNRRVIDESLDLIAVIGTDSRYSYVNPAYATIHNRKQDDFIGAHINEFLDDEIYKTVVAPNITTCLSGKRVKYESTFDFGDTGSFFMEVTYLPLFGDENRVDRIVIITRDISEQKRSVTNLWKSTEFLYNIINSLDDPVYVKDRDFRYVIVNSKLCTALGKRSEDLAGKTDFDLYPEEEAGLFRKTDEFVLRTGQSNINEEEITWQGSIRFVSTKRSLFTKAKTGKKYIVGTMRDITDHKLAEERLAYLATHDALTGLPNRSLFNELLRNALLFAGRNKHQLAVMLLDLDKFKEVNDLLGHRIGDILLREVSTRLQRLLRKSDTVSRMGGDEFLLLMPEIHQASEADGIAGKIIDAMDEPFFLEKNDIAISFSIGIAVFPDDGSDNETLIRRADMAMYAAKRASRNAFRRFSPEMDADRVV